MKNIENVREVLWNAYELAMKNEYFEGKSSEGYVELLYPSIWTCNSLEEFKQPYGIMIYSYSLGPHRSHYIYKGTGKDNTSTWYTSGCIYEKAIEVIQSWIKEFQPNL
ncbi:hypothetical protein EBU24_04455 [bacterium]|nr:hypothetical protein [bacterium]